MRVLTTPFACASATHARCDVTVALSTPGTHTHLREREPVAPREQRARAAARRRRRRHGG